MELDGRIGISKGVAHLFVEDGGVEVFVPGMTPAAVRPQAEEVRGRSFEEVWRLREECIAALTPEPPPQMARATTVHKRHEPLEREWRAFGL